MRWWPGRSSRRPSWTRSTSALRQHRRRRRRPGAHRRGRAAAPFPGGRCDPDLAPGQRGRSGRRGRGRAVTGPAEEPFIAAVKPLVDAMGGEMLPPDEAGLEDVVLSWEGADVVAVRLPQLADSLDHILAAMERRQGRPWPTWTAAPSRRWSGPWRRAAPSPYGTAWRPSRAPSASAASPCTTTSTARRAPDLHGSFASPAAVRSPGGGFSDPEFSTKC